MENIKLINGKSTRFNLWEDALKESLENNKQPLNIMYQVDDTRCIEIWVLGLAQISYQTNYSYVCYAQNKIVVLQQHLDKDYREHNFQYELEEPLVDYCTIPDIDVQRDKSRNNPLSFTQSYPIYKVKGTKDFTESEKADIKSCTVVQNILGHLCVEFCYHKKEKETLPIYYNDKDKVKVNQKLSIADLTRIVLVNSVHQEKFVVKFK